MYDTLHSSRIYSNPTHGCIFVAQLLGGELSFGARLAQPIGKHQNDFYLGEYQWEGEHPVYIIDIGPLYRKSFDTPEVKQWIEDVVEPWAREQKLKYLDNAIKKNEKAHEAMVAEYLRLQTHKVGG